MWFSQFIELMDNQSTREWDSAKRHIYVSVLPGQTLTEFTEQLQ